MCLCARTLCSTAALSFCFALIPLFTVDLTSSFCQCHAGSPGFQLVFQYVWFCCRTLRSHQLSLLMAKMFQDRVTARRMLLQPSGSSLARAELFIIPALVVITASVSADVNFTSSLRTTRLLTEVAEYSLTLQPGFKNTHLLLLSSRNTGITNDVLKLDLSRLSEHCWVNFQHLSQHLNIAETTQLAPYSIPKKHFLPLPGVGTPFTSLCQDDFHAFQGHRF